MNEQEMQDALFYLLSDLVQAKDVFPAELAGIGTVWSFDELGLLPEKGLVLQMKDGREFQIAVKRSR